MCVYFVVVREYADRLKKRYKRKSNWIKLEKQWPPRPSEKFSRLHLKKKTQPNDIIRLKMTTKDGDKEEEENAIKLQDIFKKTDEQMTIVFEGCPGSGKTALTLHLCKEWADGNMFKDYKLVVLVQLWSQPFTAQKRSKIYYHLLG